LYDPTSGVDARSVDCEAVNGLPLALSAVTSDPSCTLVEKPPSLRRHQFFRVSSLFSGFQSRHVCPRWRPNRSARSSTSKWTHSTRPSNCGTTHPRGRPVAAGYPASAPSWPEQVMKLAASQSGRGSTDASSRWPPRSLSWVCGRRGAYVGAAKNRGVRPGGFGGRAVTVEGRALASRALAAISQTG
jgi:hypothetical protein